MGDAQLESLLTETATGSASIDAYEIDLKRPDRTTRQLVVNARKLDDGDLDHIRLLLAITGVTDMRTEARLKNDLVRDKVILLQGVQHRVANSLQSIASVLMQECTSRSVDISTTPVTALCQSQHCNDSFPHPPAAPLNSAPTSRNFAKVSAHR